MAEQGHDAAIAALMYQCYAYRVRHMTSERRVHWEHVLLTIGTGRGWDCRGLEPVTAWASEASDELAGMVKKLSGERKKSWMQFLEQAALGQAGLLHKLSKAPTLWQPRASLDRRGDTQNPKGAAK